MNKNSSDSRAWLETDAMRRVSDIALGVVLLLVGAFALAYATANYQSGTLVRLGPGAFPSVVAGSLCVVALVLLARAALRRSPPPVRPSHWLYVAIVAVVIVALAFAPGSWVAPLLLRFGPAEFTALIALDLAVAVGLAHSSRVRATGMALLGLLLGIVGTDVNSGVQRFTMGVPTLSDGIGVLIVLLGLFVAGDVFICLVSPPWYLRTYTRMITGWRTPRIPVTVALVMRLAAALALAAACYAAYTLSRTYADVATVLIFGALGTAAKIFGWNRFLLYLPSVLSPHLEENIRRTLLLSRGDPWAILQRPISGTLLVAAMVIVAVVVVLSIGRAARNPRNGIPYTGEPPKAG